MYNLNVIGDGRHVVYCSDSLLTVICEQFVKSIVYKVTQLNVIGNKDLFFAYTFSMGTGKFPPGKFPP